MPTLIQPTITDIGLAAAVNAQSNGLQLAITHVVLSTAKFTPTGSSTLTGIKEKTTVAASVTVGPGAFRINTLFTAYSGAAYDAAAIGFYSGDPDAGGKLFAVYSHPTSTLVQRNSLDYLAQFSLTLARVPAGSVTVTVDPSAAQALALVAAHEQLTDPHPQYIRHLGATALLPTADEGPIWHDAYNDVMTWQSFTANGANYTGYASANIGKISLEGMSAPRAGRVKIGTSNLSLSAGARTYQLWQWAKHNGLVVPVGSWFNGRILYADNGNGTYRGPDIRGEFPRYWDDGLGADPGRSHGSWQLWEMQRHAHVYWASTESADSTAPDVERLGGWRQQGYSSSIEGGDETRPRNTAQAGVIHI
jgi:phage-related tail fiber protein